MSKITENIEGLRKVINAKTFDQKSALRFVSALEANTNELEKKIKQLKEDAFDEDYTPATFTRINCGIGNIDFSSDNLLLEMVMENLDAAIQKHNPLRVNEKLSGMVG